MKIGTKRFDEITILFFDKDIRFRRFFGSIKYDPCDIRVNSDVLMHPYDHLQFRVYEYPDTFYG